MTLLETSTILPVPEHDDPRAEANLAAAAFLARYQGRTLDAYRHDLRVFFQWAIEVGLDVLAATRPEIGLYVPRPRPGRAGPVPVLPPSGTTEPMPPCSD